MIKKQLLLITYLCCATMLGAKVKLPSLICDNMVLQQQTDIKLWGTATPKAEVRVTPSWNARPATCRADKDGRWLLKLSTPEAGYTPYHITFDDGEKLTVKNVLIGEVWLASGQSNMEMPLRGFYACPTEGGAEEIINASSEKGIRLFNVPKAQSYEPLDNCGGSWATPSVETASSFSAVAWFFAQSVSRALQVPVGIINSSFGGAKVESWTNRELVETYPDICLDRDSIQRMTEFLRPVLMYNAMLKPLQNFTVKGFIWYQGCSNVDTYATYADRLSRMVQLWRKEWGQGDIPFYYVEIAPHVYREHPQMGKAAYLREAQAKALELIPNSGMISTNDLVDTYERYNIHPRQKRKIGQRLSYMALNRTYGMEQLHCYSPQYKSLDIIDGKAIVSFDHLEEGICRFCDYEGFEIAGEDRVFHPADKVRFLWQTGQLEVSSQKVPRPAAVRYCFRDFQPGNMIGGNELPLIPFRTDNWDE